MNFTLQRFQVEHLDANVNKNVRAYLQLQDVRAFGDEGGTVREIWKRQICSRVMLKLVKPG